MRTTIDVSDDLMKKAKTHAVQQGITIKQLFTRLLEQELGVESEQASKPKKSSKTKGQGKSEGESNLDKEIEAITQKMWKRLEG